MKEQIDLSNISVSLLEDFLNNFKHPTVYHIQYGRHPGNSWWLKTICPDPNLKQLDLEGFGNLWFNFADRYSNLIKLTDIAFDWTGEKIPNTWTVWLNDKMDVIITDINEIKFVDKFEGEILAADLIKNHTDFKNNETLIQAATCLADNVINQVASNKRNNIKIVSED